MIAHFTPLGLRLNLRNPPAVIDARRLTPGRETRSSRAQSREVPHRTPFVACPSTMLGTNGVVVALGKSPA